MSERKRRPEQRMRHPHFGRKAEYQRAEQGGRGACKNEDGVIAGPVGDESPAEPEQRRDIEKKSVDDDAAVRTSCKPNKGFGGPESEKENRYAVSNIVPVERPYVLDGDRVGKHRAVGVKLKLINERDDDKGERPAEAGGDNQIAQKCLLAAGRQSRCSLHCA